jgi:potassium efflux system protein
MAARLLKQGKNRKAGFVFATMLALSGPAFSQTAEETGVTELSSGLIESRIEQVRESSSYDESNRSLALDNYLRALANLETEKAHRDSAERFEQARTDAPQETQRLRSALEAKLERDPLASLEGIENSAARDIEQRLEQERANAAAVKAKLTEFEQKLAAEELRPQAARQRVSEASQEARIVTDRLSSPPPSDEPDIVLEARRWAQQTAAAALRAEIRKLDQELLSQPMRVALLQVQREEAGTNLNRIQSRVDVLQSLLSERRREETEQVIAEIDLSSLGAAADHPVLQQVILENRELADELDELSNRLEETTTANETAEQQLADIRQRYQSAQQRLEVAGLGKALGRYLGEERRKLPAFSDYRRDSRLRDSQIAEAGLRDIQLGEQWRDIRDADSYVQSFLMPMPEDQAQNLRPALVQLADARRGLLQQAIALNSNYLRGLADLEYTEKQRFSVVSEYRIFLAERLLWVRNRDAMGLSSVLGLPGELVSFLSPGRWLDTVNVFLYESSRSPLQMLAILILLLFWWKLGSLRTRLKLTSRNVGKPSEDSFTVTAQAVIVTLIMTLPWPIFTAVSGYGLTNSLLANAASRDVGEALMRLTPLLFFLRTFRLFCTPGGVAEGHFRWSVDAVRRLRRQLDILMLTLLVPGFVILVERGSEDLALGGALSPFMFLILAGGIMVFLHRLLMPRSGIIEDLRRRTGTTLPNSWRWIWITAATVIPVGVAVMTLAGFAYSAATLLGKLISTTWLIFFLVIVRELIVRWLLVIKRRLLLQQVLQRREAARAAKDAGDSETTTTDEHDSIEESPAVDIASLDADTQKLVSCDPSR